jgi:hypothetical protein
MRLLKAIEVGSLGGRSWLLTAGAEAGGLVSGLQMIVRLLQLKRLLQLAIPRRAALT